MNQKNVFTGIAFILLIMSFASYFFGVELSGNNINEMDDFEKFIIKIHLQLVAMFNLIVVLALFATREYPKAVWAFTIGFALLALNTVKHMVVDGVDVPIFAVVIQFIFAILCAYLWLTQSKTDGNKSPAFSN